MTTYRITWITDHIAAGYAPLSNEDLELLKEEEIEAIVNLCGEFCDLHEIQAENGFEVYYLPIPDECAPDMTEMGKTLDWIDDKIGQGKKVLIHCRFGIGRTGTLMTAYLMKSGMSLKEAGRKLKGCRSNPTNYCQWKLLRNYEKKKNSTAD